MSLINRSWREIDPFSSEMLDNRYDFYSWLRDEYPVYFYDPSDCPHRRLCLITRHEDVYAAFRDPRLVREFGVPRYQGPERQLGGPFETTIADWMVYRDPPRHSALREPFEGALRAVRSTFPAIVGEVVDSLIAQLSPGTSIDLIPALALPVPGLVICKLVGLDTEIGVFREWMASISGALERSDDTQAWGRCDDDVEKLNAALDRLIDKARHDKGTPFMRELVRRAGACPQGANDHELRANLVLLLFAGYETTLNLIANTAYCLLSAEAVPDSLMCSIDEELAGRAVDECLRYEAPVQMTYRGTIETIELNGVTLPPNVRVALVIGSAGRDSAKYPDPDKFDIFRQRHGHMGFGHQMHLCPGAALGRLEAQLAISRLFRRFPLCRREADFQPRWKHSMTYRALHELKVSL